jgi:cobalt-zinc-cadmium efflux system outer membrane protein
VRRPFPTCGVPSALLLLALAFPARAQLSVTRTEAERAALAAGARVALARADTALALAKLRTASALPNPTLGVSYSKSVPTTHVSLELPLFDALWTRNARVGQARAEARAARLLYASERLAALVEVDTTYTASLAADAHFRLSRQNAREADSLRTFTVQRRDAGDASDLDVDLAAVSAGQQINVATNDSLTYMSALLTLQMLMGISPDSISITLADSLTLTARDTATFYVTLANGPRLSLPLDVGSAPAGMTGSTAAPSVLAAEASLAAATQAIALQRRSIWQLPSLSVGFETGDPDAPGLLPTIGIALPLPIFSRNQGPIAEAEAARERARIELLSARLEVRRRLVEGAREREQLIAKVVRDRDLVIRAQRVAEKSLTAYREGASGLPAVLEARRSAREVLSQYIDDLAALLTVNSELRALTQTVTVP